MDLILKITDTNPDFLDLVPGPAAHMKAFRAILILRSRKLKGSTEMKILRSFLLVNIFLW